MTGRGVWMQYLREHHQFTLVATQVKQQRVKLVKLARQNDQHVHTRTGTSACPMWACVEEKQASNLVNNQVFEKYKYVGRNTRKTQIQSDSVINS